MSTDHRSGRDHTVIDILDDKEKRTNCIFRVPNVLWRQNPAAYTPDVVSIGPFHHYPEKRGKDEGKGGNGEKYFQLMERVKASYLKEILTGMKKTLKELTAEVIKLSDQKNEGEFEQRARAFYAEPLDDHISSEEFIKMMIVDGCFLIQLFRKCNDKNLRAFDDPVFNMDCMFHFLCHDILLLENQLPWFVLESLYSLILGNCGSLHDQTPLSFLILGAFSRLPSLEQSFSSCYNFLGDNNADYLHILDLVRNSILIPSGSSLEREIEVDYDAIIDPADLHKIPPATALSNVGIKFKEVNRESITKIKFTEGRTLRNNGILEIPQLYVGMLSETLFRNLIAIEQCYHGYSNEITSYAIFMDNLISSKEDMDLLRKENIIGNWMSDEDGYKFFSNLHNEIPINRFYYVELCKTVNYYYYESRRHQLIGENTRRELKYFSNPWRVFYVIVGFFLLQIVPTILQTAFTIKQYYNPSPKQ